MEQSTASLFRDIRSNLQSIVHPSLVTKNNDTQFEIWVSRGVSSLFFSSISLYSDHINIKFSPKLPNENQAELKVFHHGFGLEYNIPSDQITEATKDSICKAIDNLFHYYQNSKS